MNAQHTADNILIDLHTESLRDLLRNAGTTPAGITPLHRYDGLDEVFVGSLRAGPTAVPGRLDQEVTDRGVRVLRTTLCVAPNMGLCVRFLLFILVDPDRRTVVDGVKS